MTRLERIRMARGTNQYKSKPRKRAIFLAFMLIALTWLYLVTTVVNTVMPISHADAPRADHTKPYGVISYQDQPEGTFAKYKSYIYTIFGKDAQVACAVAFAESHYDPKAQLEWAMEDSIGLFQINLQSKYAKVHFNRVPGTTLTEKEEWLRNPYNNTLMAYWIFKTSGWTPWTGYTSGNYKAYMEVCK